MTNDTLARHRRAALASLILGVLVMVAFDRWFTLVLGVTLMLGAVVGGMFTIAVPGEFLDHDRPEDAPAEADANEDRPQNATGSSEV